MDEFEQFEVKPFVKRLLGASHMHFLDIFMSGFVYVQYSDFICMDLIRNGRLVGLYGQNTRCCANGSTARAFTKAF